MQKKLLGLSGRRRAGSARPRAGAGGGLRLRQHVGRQGEVLGAYAEHRGAAHRGVGSVSKWDVQSHASNYGIRGRENIGGGQTAWFQIEQNAPMERSNNVAITPAVAQLRGRHAGRLGQLLHRPVDHAVGGPGCAVGHRHGRRPMARSPRSSAVARRPARRRTRTAPTAIRRRRPGTCDAVEAGGGVGHAFWRRVSQAVLYQSPVFGGVQVKFAYQTNEGKATTTTAARS